MKSLGFVIMLIVVGALAFANGANATSPPSWARVEKIHSNDPLRMAHLVMEATFVRVDVEQLSHERYCNLFMQESLSDDARKRNSLGVLYAELKDIRVIRGNRPVRRLATFPYPVTRLESGQRVIVCGYYIPAAGEYFAFGPECTLWKTDQGWKRESYNGPDMEFTSAELDSFFNSQSFQGVLERTPTVVEARIVAVHDSSMTWDWKESPGPVKMGLCELDDIVVLKGSEPRGSARNLVFIRGWGNGYSPDWDYIEPHALAAGDRWILFLDTEPEYGLSYPVGGKHGMLKVQGTHLIFDNKVRYPMSRMDVFSAIQRRAFLLSKPPVE